ncbi:MAG: MFS transporter [Microscillaceae bacterium]|nr:MFS transporter [Microscillaceae bacterium]
MKNALLPHTNTQQAVTQTFYPILLAISFSHLLNDVIQSVIPAIYPMLKEDFSLNFTQIGLITLTFQITASILQPIVGIYTDRRPQPYSLAIGMGFTFLGLVLLSQAFHFYLILASVVLIGVGSSIFHPESSRVAYLASGGKRGMAQSLFQLGGNAGSALGPLLAALIIIPFGQTNILWFCLVAMLAIIVLYQIARWYKTHHHRPKKKDHADKNSTYLMPTVLRALAILLLLMFSKFFYLSSMTSYFTFYLIDRFQVSVASSQFYLFVFLAAVAVGTFFGGPMGDRFGRKYIIWISILGVAPFALLLPYVDLFWTIVLVIPIGLILASAFSAILVYAQELMPGKVGMISGLFFGLAFGMGGLGSALLGKMADLTSIYFVYQLCAFLPLIGILTAFLPEVEGDRH